MKSNDSIFSFFSFLLIFLLISPNLFGHEDCLNHDMSIPAVQDQNNPSAIPTEQADLSESDGLTEEIPFWQQADYIIETPDVITLDVSFDHSDGFDLKPINNQHLVDSDGFITLGKYGRVKVGDLTAAECDEAVLYHLSKPFGTKDFNVKTSVYSCNSKEYHVVFLSPTCGQQQLRFSYLGHTTVLDALSMLNSENELVLPEGINEHFVVLRSNKEGKPIEMISVNLEEAFAELGADPDDENDLNDGFSKNIVIKPGDTILLAQDFQGEDLRPDAGIASEMNVFPTLAPPQNEDLFSQSPAADNDFGNDEYAYQGHRELLADLLQRGPIYADFETKTASQFDVDSNVVVKEKSSPQTGTIAKTIFFDGERFPLEGFGELDALQQTLQPNTSISFIIQTQPAGLWMVLYGEKETVESLYDVFSKIASGNKE